MTRFCRILTPLMSSSKSWRNWSGNFIQPSSVTGISPGTNRLPLLLQVIVLSLASLSAPPITLTALSTRAVSSFWSPAWTMFKQNPKHSANNANLFADMGASAESFDFFPSHSHGKKPGSGKEIFTQVTLCQVVIAKLLWTANLAFVEIGHGSKSHG